MKLCVDFRGCEVGLLFFPGNLCLLTPLVVYFHWIISMQIRSFVVQGSFGVGLWRVFLSDPRYHEFSIHGSDL